MSAIRYTFLTRRLPPTAALLVLCVVLICGQVASAAHAEVDCENESCALCIGSVGDNAPGCDSPLPIKPRIGRFLEVPLSELATVRPTQAQLIRGPPTT